MIVPTVRHLLRRQDRDHRVRETLREAAIADRPMACEFGCELQTHVFAAAGCVRQTSAYTSASIEKIGLPTDADGRRERR